MALPPLASEADLAAWVGQADALSDPRAGAVLSAASSLVRAHTGQSWPDPEVSTPVPDVVQAVVVQVAGRVWSNPDGLTSVTLDDGTRRWQPGSTGLMLTDAEKELLAEFSESGRPSGLGVISTTRGEPGGATIYVPTGPPPSGPPFPWYSTED